MKITVISLFLSEETTRWIFDFLHSLEVDGYTITVIRGTKKYTGMEEANLSGLTFRQVRLFPRKFDSNILRMLEELYFTVAASLKLLLLPQQDVVIGLTTPMFVHLAALPHRFFRNLSMKFVLWVMDCHPELEIRLGLIPEGGMIARGLRLANRLFVQKIDAVVALDHAMHSVLTKRYRETPVMNRIVVIPNWNSPISAGVTLATFWDNKRYARRPRFLYSGNAGRVHEFDTLLKAARRVQEDGCDVVFVFSGYGQARAHIKEQIETLELSNCFLEETVHRDCLESAISQADVTVITLRDGMGGLSSPSKLYTSLMLGKPVLYIGPGEGNVQEAVDSHECGIAVRNGDVDQCVADIVKLAVDPGFREELSKNAENAYAKEYNPAKSYSAFRIVLGELMKLGDG